MEPDGLVKDVIPSFRKCEIAILSSPKLEALFVDYLLFVSSGGYSRARFGGEGIETFLHLSEGPLKVWNEDKMIVLAKGGYIFCPEGRLLHFKSLGGNAGAFLYKRKYVKQEDCQVHTATISINDVDWMEYEDMAGVRMKDFLPVKDNLGSDMNFHILSFKPGASHGYAETHMRERGAHIYSGQGMHPLDHDRIPAEKGDYLFVGVYCPQAAYGVGRDEGFAYIYSRDCNRDVFL